LELINKKFHAIINYMVAIGLFFFALAVATLFYPDMLQILFVITFFAVSFLALLIAVKIHNIKESFDNVLLIFPKGKKVRRIKK